MKDHETENDRDETLTYDDENPIWCEGNVCDIASCHRCFPRKGCTDHFKCQEQGEQDDAETVFA